MNNILLKGIGGGIVLSAFIGAWFFFPSSKENISKEKEIIFDKNVDRQQAAKQLLMLEITSSSYSKKQKKIFSSKNSRNNVAFIEPIKTYNDDDIINGLIGNNSSSSSSLSIFSSVSSKVKFSSQISDTNNFCNENSFLCNITNFEQAQNINQLQVIKTILNRFGYNREDYLNSINIVYNPNGRRGYATHSHMVINGYNLGDKEFWEVFTHELGHIIDLGIIKGNGEKDQNFTEFGNIIFAKNDPSLEFYKLSRDGEKTRKAGAKSQDFVSGYGMSDPFEDYAESFNMYINHKEVFLAMTRSSSILKQKYDIIDKQFSGKSFFKDIENSKKIQSSLFWRPWDSTRMN